MRNSRSKNWQATLSPRRYYHEWYFRFKLSEYELTTCSCANNMFDTYLNNASATNKRPFEVICFKQSRKGKL